MKPDRRLGVVARVGRLVHGGARRLAAGIVTRLDERLDFDVMFERFQDLYERLYAGRRGRPSAA